MATTGRCAGQGVPAAIPARPDNRQTVPTTAGHFRVDEITARRINIVEPDGRLALVISDHALQHPAAYDKGIDALKKQGLIGVDRLFLGRTKDSLTGLFLRDDRGIPRLRIFISKENQSLIQTLDDQGRWSPPCRERDCQNSCFPKRRKKKAPTDKSGAF